MAEAYYKARQTLHEESDARKVRVLMQLLGKGEAAHVGTPHRLQEVQVAQTMETLYARVASFVRAEHDSAGEEECDEDDDA